MACVMTSCRSKRRRRFTASILFRSLRWTSTSARKAASRAAALWSSKRKSWSCASNLPILGSSLATFVGTIDRGVCACRHWRSNLSRINWFACSSRSASSSFVRHSASTCFASRARSKPKASKRRWWASVLAMMALFSASLVSNCLSTALVLNSFSLCKASLRLNCASSSKFASFKFASSEAAHFRFQRSTSNCKARLSPFSSITWPPRRSASFSAEAATASAVRCAVREAARSPNNWSTDGRHRALPMVAPPPAGLWQPRDGLAFVASASGCGGQPTGSTPPNPPAKRPATGDVGAEAALSAPRPKSAAVVAAPAADAVADDIVMQGSHLPVAARRPGLPERPPP
mmetsp:Transcript_91007/g.262365  ORF Transcript_91007/g.262365 Transcript_91007/m.262365 type:complete len:346 (-) Transcript_91007:8-1045(-)